MEKRSSQNEDVGVSEVQKLGLQVEGFGTMWPLMAPCWEKLGKSTAGKWRACGWAVVQLDHGEEMGPLCGMYGSMEAAFEVQRTIKRAALTALLCLLRKVIGLIKVHVDNKGIIDGL